MGAVILFSAPSTSVSFRQKEPDVNTSTISASTLAITLDEVSVGAKLEELRQLHADNKKADDKGADELAKSQQERLRTFLAEGYPQAYLLMQDENRALLIALLKKHGLEPKNGERGLLQQIAFMQIAKKNKDKKWVSPTRREERIGNLYRIFREKGWTATDDIVAKIIAAKGTSAIIEQDKADSVDPEAEKDMVRRRSLVYGSHQDTYELPWNGVTTKNTGEWRLALVSVHHGAIRVRKLVGKKDDAAVNRERDAFCKLRAAEIMAMKVTDQTEQQGEADQAA